MAGDKLDENTKESQDAAEALSRSERNKQTREKIGNDPDRLEERISVVDRDEYDLSGFSDKEINMALQGGTFDQNDQERLTGITTPVNEPEGGIEPPVDGDPVVPETAPITAGPTNINTGADFSGMADAKERAQNVMSGKGSQNVSQDNDQVSNVTGNNNYVDQTQDNSIRNYGGDKRVFNYQGGSGNDSPASMATMAGLCAADDSHPANASS